MDGNRPILLLEDDQVDIMNMQRAFHELHVANKLIVLENGEEGLKYLEGRGIPCLILLDLNMPKMNGIEFLKVIKKNPQFKRTPVVVLTTSREEQDKIESYNLGVAGYMIKPVDYKEFVQTVRTIDLYWTLSEMPG